MSKVSIIVPVYNTEKYIEKCLKSLLNQTLKDIEIIVIDDGSTDNSKNIIKNFTEKDSRFKYWYKENGGQATARNLGISKASGEYIAFIDSDDYVDKSMCKEMYECAINNNSDIVSADYYLDYGSSCEYIVVGDSVNSFSQKDYIFSGAGPCNKLYKKSFLIENDFKFPEGIIYEDYAVIPALVKFNPTVSYINKGFLYYVQNESSTMRSESYKKKFEDIFEANEILYNLLKDTEFKNELEFLIINHMLYLGSLNFYKYHKFEQIDRISDFIMQKFPTWRKNKYLKKCSKKERFLMLLFYKRKYKLISNFQKIKRCFNA